MEQPSWDRRSFCNAAGKISAGLIVGASGGAIVGAQSKSAKSAREKNEEEEDIGPTEDLMREHGVLNRVLLIYDYFIVQIEQNKELKLKSVSTAADVNRKFVEDYHERQEEQFLFPRFEKASVLTVLVPVLKAQHQAGRRLTDQIVNLAKARDANDRTKIAQSLRHFVAMYRPHEAREDTVLFPELRKIVSAHEFDALGEEFETNEHKQFGARRFRVVSGQGCRLGEADRHL
jgi:hemerythrin-like domain-containing protein